MSIVAAPPPVKVAPPLIDTSSTLVTDPWQRAEAAATLISAIAPVLTELRQIRQQAVMELVATKTPLSHIAKHVRLSKQRIDQIVKAARSRVSGVAV